MDHSTRRNIAYPSADRSDPPDMPLHFKNIVDNVDWDVIYDYGTDAARIAAAHQGSGGRFWWTTDTHQMWYDDGTAWWPITSPVIPVVRLARTSNFTITLGAGDTAIAWNGETYDNYNMHAANDSKIIPVVAGFYSVTAELVATAGMDVRDSWGGGIRVNGGSFYSRVPSTNGVVISITMSSLIYFNGTKDYVEITCSKNSPAGNITDMALSSTYTHMDMHRVSG